MLPHNFREGGSFNVEPMNRWINEESHFNTFTRREVSTKTHLQNLSQYSTENRLEGTDEILLRCTRPPLCRRNPLIVFSTRYLALDFNSNFLVNLEIDLFYLLLRKLNFNYMQKFLYTKLQLLIFEKMVIYKLLIYFKLICFCTTNLFRITFHFKFFISFILVLINIVYNLIPFLSLFYH